MRLGDGMGDGVDEAVTEMKFVAHYDSGLYGTEDMCVNAWAP
jgi:hypothetical protein